jgi:hypothetical protein
VDLPLPLSPAMPSVSPRARSKDTPSTTRFARPSLPSQETTSPCTLSSSSANGATARRIEAERLRQPLGGEIDAEH